MDKNPQDLSKPAVENYRPAPYNCRSIHRFLREFNQSEFRDSSSGQPLYLGGHWGGIETFAEGCRFRLFSQSSTAEFEILSSGAGKKPSGFEFGQPVVIQLNSELVGDWSGQGPIKLGESFELEALVTPQREWRGSKNIQAHLAYQSFLSDVVSYLETVGLDKVTTPSLVVCPGMEVELEPFCTEAHWAGKGRPYFLPTSPELHLKKLMASGMSDIFEIKTCFRNNEVTNHHAPEFQMLEWYRGFADLDAIVADLEGLLQHLAARGHIIGDQQRMKSVSVQKLFQEHLGLTLKPDESRESLLSLAESKGHKVGEEDSWEDLFHRLFVSHVEPQLEQMGLVIVTDYPPRLAALSRIESSGWAGRFEFYWRGLEIANAFHELNDPSEQRQRFKQEIELRKQRGRTPVPIDEEFMECLEIGLPPSSGIALGLERLFMACHELSDIDDLRLFKSPFRY